MWMKSRPTNAPAADLFESLEPRVVLHQIPMATGFFPLSSLEERNVNSVVRILTNVGRIDIELFEGLVPNVTANFRSYIESGKFDEDFFHMRGSGVLQTGRYKFNDGQGLETITPNAPISNGFSRSNLERTLAMVPFNTIQADSQWIINLQNNPILDTQSGGFTVFAKVIQGWDIVTTIAGYTVRDLNQALLGTGTGPFTAVPTTPAYNPGVGPTEATLVKIIDIETIKAPGLPGYYSNAYAFPEGFRSGTTTERIDVVNTDLTPGNINYFQIIIRYENGDRDQVLFKGQLASGVNDRMSFKVNDQFVPGLNIVRPGVGYAFEVRSTRKLGVSLDHRDNGVTLAESFQVIPQIPTPQFTRYTFARATKGANQSAFLVVQELDGKNVTINVLIYPASGGQIYIPISLEAFRRGGLNLNAFPSIPNGDYSMYMTCLTPFMAAVSQYNTNPGVTDGASYGGVQGLGRVEGILAGAYLATGGQASIDVVYPGVTSIVIVDFVIRLTNGTTLIPSPVTLTQTNRRFSLDLTTVPNLPRDQFFTITYSERQGVNAVSASYRSKIAGDEVSTPFQINSTQTTYFADGYTDPTLLGSGGMSEIISVFNPYADAGVQFFYQLLFQFSDGSQLFAPESTVLTLGSLQRADHRAANYTHVLNKISSNAAFRFYSIQVIAAPFAIPVPIGGSAATLTRIHNTWGQSLASIPSIDPTRQVVYFDNPEFNPP